MVTDTTIETKKAWKVLDEVMDPEVPVISVTDLGIIRELHFENDTVFVTVTPTYTGCPATEVINMLIRAALLEAGFAHVHIEQVLSPAWTTDWMSERGKQRLEAYGIAAPLPRQQVCHPQRFALEEAIRCPHCHSYHSRRISEFGSTACKALYQCLDCQEPFDYFKCH